MHAPNTRGNGVPGAGGAIATATTTKDKDLDYDYDYDNDHDKDYDSDTERRSNAIGTNSPWCRPSDLLQLSIFFYTKSWVAAGPSPLYPGPA
jgi:hypothetical protein